jgi:hypothetical protein
MHVSCTFFAIPLKPSELQYFLELPVCKATNRHKNAITLSAPEIANVDGTT